MFAALRGDDPELTLFPARDMVGAGVTVASSSDHPCGGGLAPLEIMAAAVRRTRTDGEPIDPEQALAPVEALRACTLDAARACGRDPTEGSLAPGKRANLTIVRGDPLERDPATCCVLETWIGGRRRWRRGAPPGPGRA